MKTVLVDVDDTLADTQVAMLSYINSKAAAPFRFEDLTRDHREKEVPEYEQLVQEFLSNPDLVKGSKPYTKALEALERLHVAGYQIHIASARKEPLHDATTEWLQKHGFTDYITEIHPRSSKHQGEEFKRMVAEKIKPTAAFDDTLEVAETLAGSGTTVYLIHKPWNATATLPANIIRADDFVGAVNLFLSPSQAPTPPS